MYHQQAIQRGSTQIKVKNSVDETSVDEIGVDEPGINPYIFIYGSSGNTYLIIFWKHAMFCVYLNKCSVEFLGAYSGTSIMRTPLVPSKVS